MRMQRALLFNYCGRLLSDVRSRWVGLLMTGRLPRLYGGAGSGAWTGRGAGASIVLTRGNTGLSTRLSNRASSLSPNKAISPGQLLVERGQWRGPNRARIEPGMVDLCCSKLADGRVPKLVVRNRSRLHRLALGLGSFRLGCWLGALEGPIRLVQLILQIPLHPAGGTTLGQGR